MSHKFGFPAMTNRAMGNKSSSSHPSKNDKFLVRVISINLSPTGNNQTNYSQIGVITGQKVTPQGVITGKVITSIFPSNTSIKKFPVENEYVWVWKSYAPNSPGGQWVWDGPVSLYGNTAPNANIYPLQHDNVVPPSQKLNYNQIDIGAVNVVNNEYNSTSNPNPYSFDEKGDIHPLLPFKGDVLYEGRWGNSIRFGSTTPTPLNIVGNPWSSSGEKGNPITIVRNGQDLKSSNFGAEHVVEDINKDLSSIYLTSTQKIPFSLTNENFISYTTPPITPAQYTNPQVILNSSRVVINAKTDSVLISGQKSVGLSSNGSINIESTSEINIASKSVHLGNKNATQSVLRGDETVEYLKILIKELQNISEALKVVQDWPGGTPVPNPAILTTANSALQVFNNVYNQIDNVKSKIVKTV